MAKTKDRIASGAGSVLEWYDFSLYGFFAPLLAQVYFPNKSYYVGLLATFSAFAIGFIARPIGALIFGHISDKFGRAYSLKLTPILITIPTLGLAILPSYNTIGILAPLLLVLLRIIQGICIGGEFSNNLVYLCETANNKQIYFLGSLGSCTGSLGILLASTIASIWYLTFSPEILFLWGWRLAFGISLFIGIIAYWMRRNLSESPRFQEIQKEKRIIQNPLLSSYKTQIHDYILCFGITFLPATAFYFIFVFLPNYMSTTLHLEPSKATGENSFSLLSRLIIIPIIGFFADKIGGIKIARTAAILFLFFSFPCFYILNYYSQYSFYAIIILGLLTTLNAATTPGLLVEILKPETRCTIFSFTFNVCFGVFGGIVPLVGFLLMDLTKNPLSPIFYLMGASIITLTATFYFNKRDTFYV